MTTQAQIKRLIEVCERGLDEGNAGAGYWRGVFKIEVTPDVLLPLLHSLAQEPVGDETAELACIEALRNGQQQIDEEGVMVGVSRQALDETLSYIDRIRSQSAQPQVPTTRVERLEEAVSDIKNYLAGKLPKGGEKVPLIDLVKWAIASIDAKTVDSADLDRQAQVRFDAPFEEPQVRPENSGHGHVYPRPDGMRARCGGPGMCAECSKDLARQAATSKPQPPQSGDERERIWEVMSKPISDVLTNLEEDERQRLMTEALEHDGIYLSVLKELDEFERVTPQAQSTSKNRAKWLANALLSAGYRKQTAGGGG